MGDTPWWNAARMSGDDYDAKFAALERSGVDMHGEANFVASLGVQSVLDAGCGTGRVAMELARRGIEVVGVDRDAEMLRVARQKAPHLEWYREDLTSFTLSTPDRPERPRRFEAVVMAGNVMIFLDPGAEATVVANLARHLVPGGLLVAGFQLMPNGLRLDAYDAYAASAGLELVERWATWEREPWDKTCDYAVCVHALRFSSQALSKNNNPARSELLLARGCTCPGQSANGIMGGRTRCACFILSAAHGELPCQFGRGHHDIAPDLERFGTRQVFTALCT